MVAGNNEGGVHMYATEQAYVITYLAISFRTVPLIGASDYVPFGPITTTHVLSTNKLARGRYAQRECSTPRGLAQARPNC
jgi:hypothetical protein